MPLLTTPEELLTALGSSAYSADPLADLAKRGYTLSDSLTSQWQAAVATQRKPMRPLTPKGSITFQAPRAPIVPAPPAANGYDVVAGLTLAVADDALSALYDSGTIPHEVALDQELSQGDLEALGGAFVLDRTGGQLSRLLITSAPTLNSTSDGSNILALQIPIQLNWNVTMSTVAGPIQRTITDAVGTLQLTMTLAANVVSQSSTNGSSMTFSVQLLTDESAATSPRLTLAANSPVQLANPVPMDQIDGFAVLIQNALSQHFNGGLSFTVSPHLALPIGNLDIRHVDVITRGEVLVAGLQVVGTSGTGVPSLLTNLLPNSATNMFLQVQEAVASLLIQSALNSGALTSAAQDENDNAIVDSASTSFQNNSLIVQISGHLVNECPFHVDLGFIHTRTISVVLEGGQIEIDQSDGDSIWEASNLWCVLATLGFIGLAALGGAMLGGLGVAIGTGLLAFALSDVGPFLLDKAYDGIFEGGGGDTPIFVYLNSPIPGTDTLPTLSAGYFEITPGAMLLAATASLQPDNVNTVIYARFLVPGGIEVFSSKPLSGATIELMDQDAPAPAGDDAPTTAPATTSGGKFGHQTSTSYSFEAPISDQQLATGETDLNGVVRFALDKDSLTTTAGSIKATTTRFDADTDRETTTTTTTPVLEAKPDLYFRVNMPDGSVVDTRNLPGGFMLNFESARIGTLADPLTFTFGPSITGVLDNDAVAKAEQTPGLLSDAESSRTKA